MRLSFVSALALIAVMMPLQASAGVSSRSSIDTPSVFAVRKSPSPTSTAVFGIPRGGAAPVKAKAPVVKLEPPTSISDLFSKERLGWTISLFINLAYLVVYFARRANAPAPCGFEKAGFCVTNLPECVTGDNPLFNSHTYAFIVDMIYTYFGLKVKNPNHTAFIQLGLVLTIFAHGCLHGLLGLLINCGAVIFPGAIEVFTAFAILITFFVLQSTGDFETPTRVVLSLIGGWLTKELAGDQGQNGISSIFLVTQLFASLASVFRPGDFIYDNQKLGNSFVPPCLISFIELTFCCDGNGASLFNKIGGHVWYDVFLHRAVYFSLLDGKDKPKKG